jgi:cell wall-associated NlpC family hydrolase
VTVIAVDPSELSTLAQSVQDTTAQLIGISVDIRQRMAMAPLADLAAYGVDASACVSDVAATADGLTRDSTTLEQAGLQLEQVLVQTAQSGGAGGLAGLQAAMPDLWWFHMVSPPPLPAAATTSMSTPAGTAVQAIMTVSQQLGIDPFMALADATVETGHPGDVTSINPFNTTGDNGTSIGIYQLHWGGELNSLGSTFDAAKSQALDPTTNAQTALAGFAAIAHEHPDWTPGQIAAAAQRPADPVAYAAEVNSAYAQIKAAGIPSSLLIPVTPTDAALQQRIVASAEAWVGTPYVWGGGHPGGIVSPGAEGVDCSGLVRQVFGENGLNFSGTAASLYAAGTPVPNLAAAQPGDLLFWGTSSNIHHVAIYIGNGMMIEAPHTGATVHVTAVYGGDFYGIARVLP